MTGGAVIGGAVIGGAVIGGAVTGGAVGRGAIVVLGTDTVVDVDVEVLVDEVDEVLVSTAAFGEAFPPHAAHAMSNAAPTARLIQHVE